MKTVLEEFVVLPRYTALVATTMESIVQKMKTVLEEELVVLFHNIAMAEKTMKKNV